MQEAVRLATKPRQRLQLRQRELGWLPFARLANRKLYCWCVLVVCHSQFGAASVPWGSKVDTCEALEVCSALKNGLPAQSGCDLCIMLAQSVGCPRVEIGVFGADQYFVCAY